ncbi:MAG: glutamate--tRNA ligase, partial [Mycobacteriales bacterium]
WVVGANVPWQPADYNPAVFAELAVHAQSRIALLSDIVPMVDFAFLPQPVREEASWNKAMKPGAEQILDAAIAAFAAVEWEVAALKTAAEQVALAVGLKLGKAQAPVRVAVTGRTVGLPLFESLVVLGREKTLQRLVAARAELSGQTEA